MGQINVVVVPRKDKLVRTERDGRVQLLAEGTKSAREVDNPDLRMVEAKGLIGQVVQDHQLLNTGIVLLEEGSELLKEDGEPNVKDAALISAAQRVEHYEMAGYGTARTLAKMLGYKDVAKILQTTLDEEGAADKKLTRIAEKEIEVKAMSASK